jgi:hypothetical protein
VDDVMFASEIDGGAPGQELSEEELEVVVGGLARAWSDVADDATATTG